MAKTVKEEPRKRDMSPIVNKQVKRKKLSPKVVLHKIGLDEDDNEETSGIKKKEIKSEKQDMKRSKGVKRSKDEDSLQLEGCSETKRIKSEIKKERKTVQKNNPSKDVKKSSNNDEDGMLKLGDQLYEIIMSQVNEPYWAVSNTVKLLETDHTVPFIARYRKEQTNNMEVKQIREVQFLLDELRMVETKAKSIHKQIEKQGKMSKDVERSILQARSLDDLDHIYAPFKTGSKSSFAERAKKAGLEPAATRALNNAQLNLHEFINNSIEGCSTIEKVKQGVQHILADVIAKDKDTMDYIRQLTSNGRTLVTSEKSKSSKKEEKETNKTNRQFETYFNFKVLVRDVKPHQILALNRGDALKELTVKLELSANVEPSFKQWCQRHWIRRETRPDVHDLIKLAIDDAFKRLIHPLIIRQIRSELTRSAEKASIDVFSKNLKRLLLTPPVRGKVIIGLDPGFKNGCKVAIISETGSILHTDVLYLLNKYDTKQRKKLVEMVTHFRSDMVAIGNGTACRETEKTISELISTHAFSPLNVMYCIVNEDGASIYSVSEEAEREMPDLDPNVRSAVSIARRLQDPLVELVKNNPKNIGVGMYQHDMPEKLMKTALDGVIEECVSFVGIDLNVCNESMLRRIAGLTTARAKKIIEFREQNGGFINREQLLQIKGFGKKSYEQCAGFVRISDPINSVSNTQETKKALSENKGSKKTKQKKDKSLEVNPLDKTWIHPESYTSATAFLNMVGEDVESIGLAQMRDKINKALKTKDVQTLAEDLDVGLPTMQLIIDGLKQPLGYDIRAEYEKPLFKVGIMSMDDLKCGCVYPGRITNVTHFGCFVDIGVQKHGLIHTSRMPNHVLKGRELGPGVKVEVRVLGIEKERQRIQLQLEKLP
ncbi:S1 RNA-binding domain-containing protein 1-like [Antedon mediterranea]|uniref:S1 RNA-binding domain-containing protein 1-like n=1 Tax=Antedon mediterranea TaxID=105859 RepID=UPI003AF535AF